MSKTYALALIFTIITLISGAFYGQYRYLTDGRAEAAAFAAGVHERVVAGQLELLQDETQRVSKLLTDETKERFRPIQGLVYLIEEKREAYLKLCETIDPTRKESELQLMKLVTLYETDLVWLDKKVDEFLFEHGEQMDLRKSDIELKVERLTKELEKCRSTSKNIKAADMSVSLKRDLLKIDYLNAITLVLLDVYQLTGGVVLNCFPPPDFFPVINHGFSDPQFGETITTIVSIGKLDYSHKPEDMFVLINGDTLQMNNYGMETYSFKPTRRGKQVLKMELCLRNPLTGYVQREGVNYYSYHVR